MKCECGATVRLLVNGDGYRYKCVCGRRTGVFANAEAAALDAASWTKRLAATVEECGDVACPYCGAGCSHRAGCFRCICGYSSPRGWLPEVWV